MTDRIILHADCNNFFASCECLERPELWKVPMAVAGDPEMRTGVVVAKNELAKKCGVKTTDTVYMARQKCPEIVFVPPRHDYYRKVSQRVNAIYTEYTEYVEPASIDESYLDMTEALPLHKLTPREFADELRRRVREEIGITISVGVSFCKVFAKMASDYKKPDATTVISRDNYKDILWPLPISDLLFAGHAAVKKLNGKYINTIGDLAKQPQAVLHNLLGKQGDMLWSYANGLDDSLVRRFDDEPEIKSVSRGRTFKRDLVTTSEVKTGLGVLVDEVARNLRRSELKGEVVFVQIRRPDMSVISRQKTLNHYTYLQHEIQETAFALVQENWLIGETCPIRALTVGVAKLVPASEAVEQLSLLDLNGQRGADRGRQERLEATVEKLRRKHGDGTITLGYQGNQDIGIKRGDH